MLCHNSLFSMAGEAYVTTLNKPFNSLYLKFRKSSNAVEYDEFVLLLIRT